MPRHADDLPSAAMRSSVGSVGRRMTMSWWIITVMAVDRPPALLRRVTPADAGPVVDAARIRRASSYTMAIHPRIPSPVAGMIISGGVPSPASNRCQQRPLACTRRPGGGNRRRSRASAACWYAALDSPRHATATTPPMTQRVAGTTRQDTTGQQRTSVSDAEARAGFQPRLVTWSIASAIRAGTMTIARLSRVSTAVAWRLESISMCPAHSAGW